MCVRVPVSSNISPFELPLVMFLHGVQAVFLVQMARHSPHGEMETTPSPKMAREKQKRAGHPCTFESTIIPLQYSAWHTNCVFGTNKAPYRY